MIIEFFFLSLSSFFVQRILKYNSTFVIFSFIYLFISFSKIRVFLLFFFQVPCNFRFVRLYIRIYTFSVHRILIGITFHILPNDILILRKPKILFTPLPSALNKYSQPVNFWRSWQRSIYKNSVFEHFFPLPTQRVSTSNNPRERSSLPPFLLLASEFPFLV